MREALQSSRLPLYLKKRVYIWSSGEMGFKLGQNINFRHFLGFCSVSGRDTSRDIKSSRDINSGGDINSGRDIKFWTATGFSSLTCRGHNFFVLTRIWACEYSLESSLNVECSHEGI